MTSGPGSHPPKAPPLGQVSWCLYDWANSAFPTVITTFVFSAYFTKAIAVDEITGTSQWGIAISLSGLAVAVLSPFLGAVADHGGRRKPWIFAFTALCILSSAMALETRKRRSRPGSRKTGMPSNPPTGFSPNCGRRKSTTFP